VADRIVDRYYVDGGVGHDEPFRLVPKGTIDPGRPGVELVVAANFVEVLLAKEGHDGPVGVNYLEKLQMSTPAVLYGAMLAGVDYVLMGAGIPAQIPALLDDFAAGAPGDLGVDVHGPGGVPVRGVLDPKAVLGGRPELGRPRFVAVVSSNMLAGYLARDARSRPDGFVVEGHAAGGHNARPRGPLVVDASGQPVYGPRDAVELAKMSALGLPFWLAGGYASPEALASATRAGAAGIQVGSAFALCEESNLDPALRRVLLDGALSGTLGSRTDLRASPTGFPFKVADAPGTIGARGEAPHRERICDLGYLRVPYRKANGRIGYRCPAEPVEDYVRKGGDPEDAAGRICLCNGLIATVGLGQRCAGGATELPVVTLGDDLSFLPALAGRRSPYTAGDVVEYLLGGG
ncbi:MAG: nitronate monooxygenase, partial [Actinomycetota bacterium]|nr:nitronate monooxygenase [Actinomycetota bacterium]